MYVLHIYVFDVCIICTRTHTCLQRGPLHRHTCILLLIWHTCLQRRPLHRPTLCSRGPSIHVLYVNIYHVCMYVLCICIYTHVCIHTHTYTHTNTYTHTQAFIELTKAIKNRLGENSGPTRTAGTVQAWVSLSLSLFLSISLSLSRSLCVCEREREKKKKGLLLRAHSCDSISVA